MSADECICDWAPSTHPDCELHGAMLRDAIQHLENFLAAYPDDVFPTPPPELRAKDSVAADVLRRVAYPIVREALGALRGAA